MGVFRAMDWALLVIQILNGLQLGVLLFMLAAGLTLVFGIMDFVNLAHGSLYMVGAYFCASLTFALDSFLLALVLSVPLTLFVGVLVEILVVRHLYQRDHLDQVLATFGLILVFNAGVHLIWGPDGMAVPLPEAFGGRVELLPDVVIPVYRLAIIATGLGMAGLLYYLVQHTRLGMRIRAGASNRRMIGALGVDIKTLFTVVFGLGAAMAGLAGMMIAPITEANIGMGDDILIVAFVVIIIGGIGSVRGAFIAALIVGLIDTMGRAFLDGILKLFMSIQNAETAAPALSAMLIYVLMAGVLYFRPQGLFPPLRQ
jgi:branched-chain amino acid transport system permease protein